MVGLGGVGYSLLWFGFMRGGSFVSAHFIFVAGKMRTLTSSLSLGANPNEGDAVKGSLCSQHRPPAAARPDDPLPTQALVAVRDAKSKGGGAAARAGGAAGAGYLKRVAT